MFQVDFCNALQGIDSSSAPSIELCSLTDSPRPFKLCLELVVKKAQGERTSDRDWSHTLLDTAFDFWNSQIRGRCHTYALCKIASCTST